MIYSYTLKKKEKENFSRDPVIRIGKFPNSIVIWISFSYLFSLLDLAKEFLLVYPECLLTLV